MSGKFEKCKGDHSYLLQLGWRSNFSIIRAAKDIFWWTNGIGDKFL